jgi:hypothetical protein
VSLKLASTRWLISRRGSIIFPDSLRKWDYFKQFHGLTKHSLLQKTLPRRANMINRGGHPLQNIPLYMTVYFFVRHGLVIRLPYPVHIKAQI